MPGATGFGLAGVQSLIEIISPGHLPNNLTVAEIRTGNSNIRNPILVSYIAKGLLPYRGLGSGIKDRAIKKQIEKLKIQGRIRRIGPDKGGHWEVVE